MHFHLPKPLHGWREFAGEVGIIVVGVLIALSFEQVADSWSWKKRAHNGVEALRGELATNYNFAAEIALTAPCIDRQLATLEDRVASSGPVLAPSPNYSEAIYARYTFRAPQREWPEQVWQALAVEGVTSHLDPAFRESVAQAYDFIGEARAADRATVGLSYRLQLLARPVPLDASSRNHLIEEIEEARGDFDDMRLRGDQAIDKIRASGLQPRNSSVRSYLTNSGTLKFCRAHHLPVGRVEPRA